MISDNQVLDVLLFLVVLIPSVVLHEVAHGVTAERLGDPTARRAGRLSLNPVRHVDPVGSLLFPALLAVAGQSVWGWARPVPVHPGNFRRPAGGMALVALAGPATNLLLAAVVALAVPWERLPGATGTGETLLRLLFAFVVVNCALAVFNLLPLPPLDGSRLLVLVLPPRARAAFDRLAPYGFLALFVLILAFPRALSFVGAAVRWLVRLLI